MSVNLSVRRAFAPCRLSLATALVLYGTQALAHSAYSPHAADAHVVLPPGVYAGAQQGATLVHDYGAFQLWRVDAARRAELAATAPQYGARDRSIDLPAAKFDPLRPQQVTTALSNTKWPAAVGTRRLYVVQFAGPVVTGWLDGVRAAGATPVQYINNDAYLVLADDAAGRNLAALARNDAVVRYAGEVPSEMKVSATVSRIVQARPGESIKVAVVVAQHAGAAQTQAAIDQLGTRLTSWSDAKGMNVARLEVSPDALPRIAAFGDVMTISMVGEKRKLDETQTRILTGDFTAGIMVPGPSTPSYFDFLADIGVSTDPADYPVLAIVDDGIGNGTTAVGAGDERLTVDGDNVVSRIAFATSCSTASAAGVGGHGHLNATVAAGYDDRTGLPFTDNFGNLRGLGVNPYARVANFQIFGSGSSGNCGSDDAGLVAAQGAQNVRISSNSWGYGSIFGPATDYLDSSRFHDLASRDNAAAAGEQPTLFVFAAGNDADLGVASPGNAKNVLTVGAAENQRPNDESGAWNDGCGTPGTEADDAMDVATFSSLGPAVGDRAKPETIAPGTHVQGSASTAAGYDGSGVCDQFRPTGQTEFAASSGTSHSTPAVAGVQTLYHYHLEQENGAAPSPALLKAFTLAHPVYLTGDGANDSLPSNSQGYGQPDMSYAFDSSLDRYMEDQAPGNLFTAAGQTREWFGSITDSGEPVRIVLTWTDPAAAIDATEPLINDLDLRVTLNGSTIYRGNNFTGAFSNTAATVDDVNNTEAVFLPAGTSGTIEVEVVSSNIAADAVAGNASPLDQDYALVIVNGSQSPTFVVDATPNMQQVCGTSASTAVFDVDVTDVNGYTGTVTLSAPNAPAGTNPQFSVSSDTLPPAFESTLTLTTTGLADGSYAIDVTGTDGAMTVRTDTVSLQYSAAAATAATPGAPADDAVNVSLAPNFSWTASASGAPSSYTLEVSTTADFSNIVYTAEVSGTNHVPTSPLSGGTEYFWRVTANNGCGGTVSPTFSFTTVPVFCDVPGTAIPDNNTAGVNRSIVVSPSANGEIGDLDVSFRSNHTWIGDLIITLSKDGGPARSLMDRPGVPTTGAGCSGDNPNIIMDDEGTDGTVESSCVSAVAQGYPVAQGRYTPNQTLATFDGADFAGTWTFNLSDRAGQDIGVIQELCIVPTFLDPVIANNDTYAGTEDTMLTQAAPGVLGNDTTEGAAPLTATLVTPPASGALDLETDGSFTYMPAPDVCGAQTFTYTAGDGTETSQPATVTLNIACVNDAPQAANDAYMGAEGVTLSVLAAQGVLVNDSDVENSPLTAVIATTPSNGVALLALDGSFQYLPGAGFCGNDSFTYRANDGTANSTPATVSITVQCDNEPPVAGSLPDVTVPYGQAASINGASGYSDPDGDTMTYSATGLPASLSINPTTGAITGTPTQAEVGAYTVTVTAEDPDNATASDSFTLTVAGPAVFANGFE